jgi:hypothetical protein
MRRIAPPAHTAKDAFLLCVSSIRDLTERARFLAVAGDIETLAGAYDAAGRQTRLHMLPPSIDVAGQLSTSDMGKLYTLRMLRGAGRRIYDQLLLAAPNRKCPLCGHLPASTLDHYLSKSEFPAFAVAPVNLVPACRECNSAKLAFVASAAEEQTLHPYYDFVDGEQWLMAAVTPAVAPVVTFAVSPPATWSATLKARLHSHFQLFKLGELYAIEAQGELTLIRHELERVWLAGGESAVACHLRDCSDSRHRGQLNCWQTALYQALAGSKWFCGGGFHGIPKPQTNRQKT